jgi:S1-C subfamily serine protease
MIRRVPLVAVVALAVLAGIVHEHTASGAPPSPTKGVVLINTNLGLEQGNAAGTGIVLTKNGEVLTNNHVISGATTIKVTVPSTRRTYTADVMGYDITDDVALLKLEGASNLATASLGSSSSLKIGQATRAVGNASGAGKLVVASGKVLALNQTISVQQDDGEVARLGSLVETSARLIPGDSGGPLLNSSGRVIGLDAAGSANGNYSGTGPGYAIAVNHVRSVLDQITARRSTALVHIGATAFIGLLLGDSSSGVEVQQVVPGSPADNAGLAGGDVITAIDGTSLSSYKDVRTILFAHHPGDGISIEYMDQFGNVSTVDVQLGSGPPQ